MNNKNVIHTIILAILLTNLPAYAEWKSKSFGFEGCISGTSIHPTKNLIVFASQEDSIIYTFEPGNGLLLQRDKFTIKGCEHFNENIDRISTLTFSPRGRYLAVATLDRLFILDDYDNHREFLKKPKQIIPIKGLQSLAFSPDETYLAVGDDENLVTFFYFNQDNKSFEIEKTVHLVDIKANSPSEPSLNEVAPHDVKKIYFLNNDTVIIEEDHAVSLWRHNDKFRQYLSRSYNSHFAVSSDKKIWIIENHIGTPFSSFAEVKIYEAASDGSYLFERTAEISHRIGPISSLAIHPNNKLLIIGTRDCGAFIFQHSGSLYESGSKYATSEWKSIAMLPIAGSSALQQFVGFLPTGTSTITVGWRSMTYTKNKFMEANNSESSANP